MQLREYIESFSYDNIDSLSTSELIENGRTKLFDFNYPIFDENYRKDFETHFIRKFYMREIGFETEGRFKFELENYLIVNMPYWNNMFKSELDYSDKNPFANSLMDTTHTTKNNGTTTGSNSGNFQHDSSTGNDVTVNRTDSGFNRELESDTPDSRLAITTTNDGTGVIEYASSINENSQSGTSTETNHSGGTNSATETTSQTNDLTVNNQEDFSQHREGKIGVQTYAKMLQEHRQAFIRIENQIYNEMQELFMLIY
jgi:hypothetical protein